MTNTGNLDGTDAVQLYISKASRTENDPLCSLKNFKKIALKKGESKNVVFELTRADFETIDQDGNSILVPGEYIITVGDAAPCERSKALGASEAVTVKYTI